MYDFPADATEAEILQFFEDRERPASGGITAIGPDGVRHQFPAGTRQDVVDRVMKQTYGHQRQARSQAATAAARRRSGLERGWDNIVDGFQRSGVGNILRSADPGADGLLNLRDLSRVREGSPLDFVLDRTVGREREWFAGGDDVPDVAQVLTGGAMRGTAAAAREDQRRDTYETRARADPIRNPADFASFLGGQLLGAAVSPENWLGATRGATLGGSLARRVATRFGEQAVVAGGTDAALQGSDIAAGIEDHYRAEQTLLSAGIGGIVGSTADLAEGPLRHAWDHTRRVLRIGDDLHAPALSNLDIDPTPPLGDAPLPVSEQAAAGITVETPAGTVVDVPNPRKVDAPSEPGSETLGGPVDAQVAPSATQGARKGRRGLSDSPSGSAPEIAPAELGWDALRSSSRGSPERAQAALQHLDLLKRSIKPEEVDAFIRALDDGLPQNASGSRINERWVDWERLGDPKELLGLTGALSDIFRSTYDQAGDARQGWEQAATTAKQLDFTLSDLITTHADVTGEGGIAIRAAALRDAALASDKAFYDQLRTVQSAVQKGDLSSVPTLVEALNRTVVLGAMDAGASSEIARALQYRQRQPDLRRGDLPRALQELGAVLNRGEDVDADTLGKMLTELTEAYAAGGSSGLRQSIAKMREMGFWDYLGYAATGNLLSAPTTHIRNAFGTPIHALFQIGERYVAAGIGAVRTGVGLGSNERVTFREALAYSTGMTQAWSEALVLAREAFKRGAPVADLRSSVMTNDMAAQVPFAYSARRAADWARKPWHPKTWADAGGVALFEFIRTLGFRPSVAADEFYKALGRRMQLNALSYREAAYRASLADPEDADGVFKATLASLQDEPTAAAVREARNFFDGLDDGPDAVFDPGSAQEQMALVLRSIDHRAMAADHAQLLAFQKSGPIVDKWDQALRAVPLVKALWVNFIRTPVALLQAGLVTRNPVIGSAVAALELMTKTGREKHQALFAALASEEQALARGGAEADLVLARQALGAATLTTIWMLWAGGNLTGKQTQEQRRSGVDDYSFKLPNGTWVQYTGMSPLGEMLGLVADTATAIREHDLDDDGLTAIIGALAAAVRNNVVNKSFLSGLGDFMGMMTGGGHQATSDEASGRTLGSQIAQAVAPRVLPGGALLRRTAQEVDPVVRDVHSFRDLILANVPLLSETLAARRDFLGRPIVRPEGKRGVFQAFNVSSPSSDPLERELASLALELKEGFRIGMPPRKLNGEDLTPAEYGRLLETQGQLYRVRGKTMEETLRALIADPGYQRDLPESRAYQLKQVIERFREGANREVRRPASPLFMRDAARRTGAARLRVERRQRGWSDGQARRRAPSYGLDPQDVEELEEALAFTGGDPATADVGTAFAD